MLTGQRAFKGEDVSDTLAFILTREPDWTALPADTPPLIRRLLRRCLEKERNRRLDSAADARLEIEEALTGPSAVEAAAAPPEPASRWAWSRALTWTLAASTLGLAIALVLLWAPWRSEKVADRPLVRLDVDLGAALLPITATGSSVAISPMGCGWHTYRARHKAVHPAAGSTEATELPNTDAVTVLLARRAVDRSSHRQGAQDWGKAAPLSLRWVTPASIGSAAGAGRWHPCRDRRADGFPAAEASRDRRRIGQWKSPWFSRRFCREQAVLFSAMPGGERRCIQHRSDDPRRSPSEDGVPGGTSPSICPRRMGRSSGLRQQNNAVRGPIRSGQAGNAWDGLAHCGGRRLQPSWDTAQLAFSRMRHFGVEKAARTRDCSRSRGWTAGNDAAPAGKPGLLSRPSLSPDGQRVALDVTERSGTDLGLRLAAGHHDDDLHRKGEIAVWSQDGRYIVFRAIGREWRDRSDGGGKAQPLTRAEQYPWSFA